MAEPYFYNLKGGAGAIEHLRQKKKKRTTIGVSEKPLEAVTRVSPMSQSVGKEMRGATSEAVNRSNRHVFMRLPANARAYTAFGPISEEVGKMVLPGDRAHLDDMSIDDALETIAAHSFLGTQGVFYLRDKVKELGQELKEAGAKEVNYMKENNALKQCNGELEKVVEDLKAQLASRDRDAREFQATLAQLATLSIRVKELESEIKVLKDNVEDIGLTTEVLFRGEMCREYLDGKAEQWDVIGCIKARDELLEERDQKIVVAQAQAKADRA